MLSNESIAPEAVWYLLTNLCKLHKWTDYVHTVTQQKISLYTCIVNISLSILIIDMYALL